jgi:transposase-like protein
MLHSVWVNLFYVFLSNLNGQEKVDTSLFIYRFHVINNWMPTPCVRIVVIDLYPKYKEAPERRGTMARYSEEFKYSIVRRMMPPQNESINEIVRETGLLEATLHQWKKKARAKGIAVPGEQAEAERWSAQDEFPIVVETATLSEIKLAEYCRSKDY